MELGGGAARGSCCPGQVRAVLGGEGRGGTLSLHGSCSEERGMSPRPVLGGSRRGGILGRTVTDAFVIVLLALLLFPARASAIVKPGQGEGLGAALRPSAAAVRGPGCTVQGNRGTEAGRAGGTSKRGLPLAARTSAWSRVGVGLGLCGALRPARCRREAEALQLGQPMAMRTASAPSAAALNGPVAAPARQGCGVRGPPAPQLLPRHQPSLRNP